LHIAIDAHSIGSRLAGNESYVTNLIEALAEIDTVNRYTLYVTKQTAVERFKIAGRTSMRLTLPHTPLIRIPLTLTRELRRRPVNLLHVQYTAPLWTPCPVVATIHDLSFEHLPQTFTRRSRAQLRLTVRRTARTASHLIASSEYSPRHHRNIQRKRIARECRAACRAKSFRARHKQRRTKQSTRDVWDQR
jgi:hypothetical protein